MTEPGASPVLAILFTGTALVFAVLFQVLAAMLDRAGPIRMRHWAEEAGGRLEELYEAPAHFEAFRYLLSLLAKALPIALAFGVAVALERLGSASSSGFGTASLLWGGVVALVVLLGTELFNRVLVGSKAEAVLRRLTPTYRITHVLLYPVVRMISPLVRGAAEENGDSPELDDEASEGEIEAFLDVGAKEGILEPGEEDMILRVMDFGDAVVRSVMTPRIDMVCAPADSDLDALAELLVESSHSRIPLFEGTVDDIRGVLHIRDVLAALRAVARPETRSLVREAFVVPETKPLAELLREMQSGHHQLAIVVDEYGGVAGLVTVEDLLEEIVGEIVDEYDEEEIAAKQLEDGSWRLEGMTPLDEVEDLFDIELGEEPYETVGGLIFGHLGDVPDPGAKVEAHGLRFVVERVVGRRVDRLRVERVDGPTEQTPAPGSN
ncbi:MAG: hemolysin family protein [Thermoanaerobaculia bacterium]